MSFENRGNTNHFKKNAKEKKVLRNQSSQNISRKIHFFCSKKNWWVFLVDFVKISFEYFSLFFLSENAWFAAMCTFIKITTVGCQSPCTNTMPQNTKVHQQFDIYRQGKNACIKRSGLLFPVDHLPHWFYSMFWCWPSKYPDTLESPCPLTVKPFENTRRVFAVFHSPVGIQQIVSSHVLLRQIYYKVCENSPCVATRHFRLFFMAISERRGNRKGIPRITPFFPHPTPWSSEG